MADSSANVRLRSCIVGAPFASSWPCKGRLAETNEQLSRNSCCCRVEVCLCSDINLVFWLSPSSRPGSPGLVLAVSRYARLTANLHGADEIAVMYGANGDRRLAEVGSEMHSCTSTPRQPMLRPTSVTRLRSPSEICPDWPAACRRIM